MISDGLLRQDQMNNAIVQPISKILEIAFLKIAKMDLNESNHGRTGGQTMASHRAGKENKPRFLH